MTPLLLHTAEQAVDFLRAHVHPGATLQTDSRQIAPGDAFIAWPGAAADGRAYVAQALASGASACLVEAEGVAAFGLTDARVAALPGLKAATGLIAAQWFGQPGRHIKLLAVTGTNGKTSSACWLADALNELVRRKQLAHAGCALVGTLGMGIAPHLTPTGMTTPDPVRLQRALRGFVDQGLGVCAIEASSIGLAEQRLVGCDIAVALFTNFTQDHLDWHADMHDYWHAKRALFDWPGLGAAVVNIDDAQGAQLHAELASRAGLDLWSVSLAGPARLMARGIAHQGPGLAFTVVEGDTALALQTRLIGQYNVSNVLGVIAGLRALGISLAQAVAACGALAPVPGRMQQIALPGQPLVAVDYAHTPDALGQALQALRPLAQARGGRLWCVFGCGGDRDAGKRPQMGAIAQRGADQVLVTSDNPRGEPPMRIIQQILQGMIATPAVRAEPDRGAAIALALAEADARDVVLIAGKGHEDYQETAGVRRPFSDMQQAQAALARREQTL